MSKSQLISLAVALVSVLLVILNEQIEQNVVAVPAVLKPYLLAVILFVNTTLIPTVWGKKPGNDALA